MAILFAVAAPRASSAQEDEPEVSATIDTTLEAGEADAEVPRRRFVKWNEYNGPVTTFSFGAGLIWDFVGYTQDAESREQVGDLAGENGLRDFRLLARGKFKTKRPISWSMGYMYDGAEESCSGRARRTHRSKSSAHAAYCFGFIAAGGTGANVAAVSAGAR